MKFLSFYLFYLLTALLLVAGYLTRDYEITRAYAEFEALTGFWSFFIPTAIGSLLTALIYHNRYSTGRTVKKGMVILHFVLLLPGLFFALPVFQFLRLMFSAGAPDTAAIAMGNNLFLFFLPGPVFLSASLIVFIVGLVKAGRQGT